MKRTIGILEWKIFEMIREKIIEKERAEEMERERGKEKKVIEGMIERKDAELRKVMKE